MPNRSSRFSPLLHPHRRQSLSSLRWLLLLRRHRHLWPQPHRLPAPPTSMPCWPLPACRWPAPTRPSCVRCRKPLHRSSRRSACRASASLQHRCPASRWCRSRRSVKRQTATRKKPAKLAGFFSRCDSPGTQSGIAPDPQHLKICVCVSGLDSRTPLPWMPLQRPRRPMTREVILLRHRSCRRPKRVPRRSDAAAGA